MDMDCRRAKAWVLMITLCFLAGGCAVDGRNVVIPEATRITVSLRATTRSDRVAEGQTLMARVEEPLVVDGRVVLDRGELVTLEVREARTPDGYAPSRIRLALVSIPDVRGAVEVESQEQEFIGLPEGIAPAAILSATAGSDAAVGGRQFVPTRGRALVLLAGQLMRFSTSRPIGVLIEP